MKKLREYLVTAVKLIFLSSADPRRSSLAVRSALLALLAFLGEEFARTAGIICDLGYTCYYVRPDFMSNLRQTIELVTEFVFAVLSAVAYIGIAYGLLRKAVRTVQGDNLAIK